MGDIRGGPDLRIHLLGEKFPCLSDFPLGTVANYAVGKIAIDYYHVLLQGAVGLPQELESFHNLAVALR